MRKTLLYILLLVAVNSKGQSLTLDELIGFIGKNPSYITDNIVNKGWKLNSSENNESEDHNLLFSRKVSWCYRCKEDNRADASMYYTKDLNTDPEKEPGYYTVLKLTFKSLEFYNKIKANISLKKWKLIQDGVSDNMLFKTWNQDQNSIVLTIQNNGNQQSFSLWIYTLNPEKI
jgi:hypothetical protein